MTEDLTSAHVIGKLESLATLIAIDVQQALQAAIVMDAVGQFFYVDQRLFRFHPANTLYFSALRALEERSLVSISETVQKAGTGPLQIPQALLAEWKPLVPHRHYASHPANTTWRDPQVQRFVDEGRQHHEIKSALIWQAQLAMNQRLVTAGREPRVRDLEVTYAMGVMLEEIIRLAATPEFAATLGTREQCRRGLESFRDRYVLHLGATTTRPQSGPPVPDSSE